MGVSEEKLPQVTIMGEGYIVTGRGELGGGSDGGVFKLPRVKAGGGNLSGPWEKGGRMWCL